MNIPRILLAAGASGSGKTLLTCGLLQLLKNHGKMVASFKCGPDYIDPMFHSTVLHTKSGNLDTFFTNEQRTRYLFQKNAAGCDLAVMEGVMGYYDGIAGTTTHASAYDLARITDTPVILVVNSKGMSVSLAAYIKGFLEYRADSRIKGVILNQMSPMLYPRMKEFLETELGIKVLGYVPKVDDCVIESRHLGLVLPEEVPELHARLDQLAGILEKTLELPEILALAQIAGDLEVPDTLEAEDRAFGFRLSEKVRIGVARDEAFCFMYADNLELLEQMGAELVYFSPLHDRELPDGLDGLLLYGGYPELHGKLLEENACMRRQIAEKIEAGMPCMAECGGFMYLHETMEGMDGVNYEMAGVIKGHAFRTPKLSRFGYIRLNDAIPAHEFHYYDSTDCGKDFYASKPFSSRGWSCMHRKGNLLAGFPHLYYYGAPEIAVEFVENCLNYKNNRRLL